MDVMAGGAFNGPIGRLNILEYGSSQSGCVQIRILPLPLSNNNPNWVHAGE